jgi:hypothetical protein
MRSLRYFPAVSIGSGLLFLLFIISSCSKGGNDDSNPPAPPTVATLNTTNTIAIARTYAVVSSAVTNTGNATIQQKGFCWSKTANPTIADKSLISTSSQNTFSDTIKGLAYNTVYYIRSFATNSAGTSYGAEIQIRTENSSYTINQAFAGGKIAYIDSTGEHGLIYYSTRNYTHYRWAEWPFTHTAIGNTEIGLGKGKSNTQKILLAGNNAPNTAAKVCDQFVSGGYDDWFLPSSHELVAVKAAIPFFDISGSLYWTSTEANQYNAFLIPISAISSFGTDGKDMSWGVIPVREF